MVRTIMAGMGLAALAAAFALQTPAHVQDGMQQDKMQSDSMKQDKIKEIRTTTCQQRQI
jgi:pentapeptide MXKDX repeat protein